MGNNSFSVDEGFWCGELEPEILQCSGRMKATLLLC